VKVGDILQMHLYATEHTRRFSCFKTYGYALVNTNHPRFSML